MGRALQSLAAAAAALALAAAPLGAGAEEAGFGDDGFGGSIDPWYAGAEACALLPGSGSRIGPAFAQAVFAGFQIDDAWAAEARGLCAPAAKASGRRGNAALWGAGARVLWYFGLDLIGYERFAPCLHFGVDVFGAKRRMFDGGRCAAAGPSAGLDLYWHLDDNWSVRASAGMAFLAGSHVETVATAGIGLAFSWGGTEGE